MYELAAEKGCTEVADGFVLSTYEVEFGHWISPVMAGRKCRRWKSIIARGVAESLERTAEYGVRELRS